MVSFRGSSPLARGTPSVSSRAGSLSGLIPARAGNTRSVGPGGGGGRAHPRSRGEHCMKRCGLSGSVGSSPLARGTLVEKGVPTSRQGLIPARAGNTRYVSSREFRCRAHPRSRGEHRPRRYPPGLSEGSSPLARGTQISKTVVSIVIGLIPARAGNTKVVKGRAPGAWAHPRSRGEHASTTRES